MKANSRRHVLLSWLVMIALTAILIGLGELML